MIVRECDGGLLLVRQADHGMLCSVMAARWGAPPFTPLFPLPEVAEAMGHHDDGWRAWDQTPRLNPDTGRPYTYHAMPSDEYVEIWERGVEHARATLPPLGALLVSLHGARFFEEKTLPWERAFLEGQRALQGELLATLGHPPTRLPGPVEHLFGLLRFLDGLSLFLCEHWSSPWRVSVPEGPCRGDAEVTVTRTPHETVLDPYPFLGGALALEAPALFLAEERYDTQEDLDAAIQEATRETLVFRLAGP